MTTTPAPVYGGRYELRSQIARGGTAQVYLARDLLLDRPVALKVLFPELSTDHTFVERFRREAQAAANLMHPNIVQVFDWGESERTYFIVMEYIDGEPLSSIIRSQAPLDPPQAATIAADIAKALSYAHRHGVVHRDIKPGNVLITADGQVKVTDFGIARAIGTDEQVTQTGLVMGTATYFSPEQAQGLAVDARSDVYALGVVLFEMLCARPPFTGETPVAIAYQHVREPAPMPRSINPDIPGALETIVLQSMAKLPADRYANADEMKADLDRFVHGQSVLARPPRDGTTTGPVTTVLASTSAIGGGIDDTTAVVTAEAARRPKRAKSTTPWWLTGGVMLLVAIGLVAYFGGRSLGYFGGTSDVSVPKVTGLSLTSAESRLRQADLNSTVTHHLSVTAANIQLANTVEAQSPGPNTDEKPGTNVSLTIYGNAKLVKVPNETGQSQATAYNTLTRDGFKPNVVYGKGPNVTAKVGYVYRQSPSGGEQPIGLTVTIHVADALTEAPIPSVAGDTVIAATTKLDNEQFTVSTNSTSVVSTITVGDVVKTMPAAGTREVRGSVVTLVLSKGAVSVPEGLVGDTPSQAEAILTGEGLSFTPRIQNGVSADQVGFVVGIEPKAGTTVAMNFPVVLFVGAQNGSTTTSTSTSTSTTTTSTTTTTTTTPTTTTSSTP